MKVFNVCCIDSKTGAEMVLSECVKLDDALMWLMVKTGKSVKSKLFRDNLHVITVEGADDVRFVYDAKRMFLLKGDTEKWKI